jgi:hypothetical protein
MTCTRAKSDVSMNVNLLAACMIVGAMLGATTCTPRVAPLPLPQTVRRVAVLPPYQRGAGADGRGADSNLPGLPSMNVVDVLAQQARLRLAEKGFDVVAPSIVRSATENRVPTNPQSAAQIMRDAHLDVAAMFIDVRRWQPAMTGMKTDAVIVALDVTIVDPNSGAVLWQASRPSRPVPLYGVLLTGQANVLAGETVMKELLGSIESRQSSVP